MELVLNLLGEDAKQANRCRFCHTRDFLGVCATEGRTGDGRVTVVCGDIALALYDMNYSLFVIYYVRSFNNHHFLRF